VSSLVLLVVILPAVVPPIWWFVDHFVTL